MAKTSETKGRAGLSDRVLKLFEEMQAISHSNRPEYHRVHQYDELRKREEAATTEKASGGQVRA